MTSRGPREEEAAPLFRALFQAAADPILVVDGEGRIVLANDAFRQLLGYAPAELVGRPVEDLVPARFAGHAGQRAEYAADPRPRPMGMGLEIFARHADGREIPVDIALTPLVVGGERWSAATLRDLRGRGQGLDALRIQATALRSAANGIVITDRTGTITWVNPAACAITGYPAEELVGQHTRILKSGEHEPAFYAELWATVTRGETWSGTIVNRRKDGTHYHEEQTIAPVVDEAGEVSHFIAIKQDVSARRRNEEALAAAHAELAARVAEIESLNRQLREQTIRDPLTGLYNRRYFDEAVTRDAARAARSGEPLALAALDLDEFKKINDLHGHAAGDLVLRALARVLLEGLRVSDLVCRTGGEEFVAVLPGMPIEQALARAEEWRGRFAARTVETAGGVALRCTVSVGVACHRPGTETVHEALRRADAALYEAKRRGRNRVISAEP